MVIIVSLDYMKKSKKNKFLMLFLIRIELKKSIRIQIVSIATHFFENSNTLNFSIRDLDNLLLQFFLCQFLVVKLTLMLFWKSMRITIYEPTSAFDSQQSDFLSAWETSFAIDLELFFFWFQL